MGADIPLHLRKQLEELKELAHYAKQGKTEISEADLQRILTKEFVTHEGLLQATFNEVPACGAKPMERWITGYLEGKQGKDYEWPLLRLLDNKGQDNSWQELRLRMAAALSLSDEKFPLELTLASCRRGLHKDEIPTRPFRSMLLATVLRGDAPPLFAMPFPAANEERRLLANCALGATVQKPNTKLLCDAQLLNSVLAWLLGKETGLLVAPSVSQEIDEAITLMQTDAPELVADLRAKIQRLSSAVPVRSGTEAAPERCVSTEPTESTEQQPSELITSLPENPANPENPLEELQRIAGLMQSACSAVGARFDELEERLRAARNENLSLQGKQNLLSSDLRRFRDKVERLESDLNEKTSRLTASIKRCEQLQRDLTECNERNQHIAAERDRHKTRITELETNSRRLAQEVRTESEHAVTVLTNRIIEALQRDFEESHRVFEQEMTIDLGNYLRNQQKMIFTRLIGLGIHFKGVEP